MAQDREKITGEIQLQEAFLEELSQKVSSIAGFKEQLKEAASLETTQLAKVLLGGTTHLQASDLHLETEEEQVRVRLRVDGILQDVTSLSLETYDALLSRLKLLSGIKLNVEDRAQDGRFTFLLGKDLEVETRVSSLPSEHGESLVLRILNPQSLKSLQELGLKKDLLSLFQQEIKKPNGMILVTGPTGSGKTTTLYAFLQEVKSSEIKIVTIEDPIEYHLQGISQTQVAPNKDYTFATGLRAIVRQDPDVILVGEIRDQETTNIALQAALTGHLVFSTLHTNDAAGTVSRLLSLGADPANISAALNLVIAQRLVREVCKECSKKRKATKEELEKLKRGLQGMPSSLKPKISSALQLLEPKGCEECNATGYQGRVGIFEALLVEEDMELFLAKGPSIGELRAFAEKQGMTSMYQDGLLKALEGITTLEEVERVVAE